MKGKIAAKRRCVPTKPHAAVLQQVAEVIEHGFLVLTADSAEVAQEAAAAGHHFGEGNFLQQDPSRKKHNDVLPVQIN